MNAVHYLSTLFAPPRCLGCKTHLPDPVSSNAFCTPCEWSLIPWPDTSCKLCGIPLPPETSVCGPCKIRTPLLQSNRAAFAYGGPIREAIVHWKRPGSYGSGSKQLAQLANTCGLQPSREDFTWVPIPPNPILQRKRDFIPTLDLATELAKFSDEAQVRSLLKETSRDQSSKRPRTYKVKVRGNIPNKVLLIDDVQTTGNSAKAAARALFSHGVRQVALWTLARSPSTLLFESSHAMIESTQEGLPPRAQEKRQGPP